MAAHSNTFPWMSYYGEYKFFEQRMQEHSKVASCIKINESVYSIELTNHTTLRVFICECYAFGRAEYIETCNNHGQLDAIIISSNWCGYSLELKSELMKERVGVFDIGGFMAAINRPQFWLYLTKYEKDRFLENGWRHA